jgi:hypothetical protein
MKTGEGKLKDKIKEFLYLRKVASLTRPVENALGFYWMPVVGGYGNPFLDFVGSYNGKFFALETKGEGKEPTARQWVNIRLAEQAKGSVWWGDSFENFKSWWDRNIF